MYRGWYHVAFERDLSDELTAATIGELRLVIVRTAEGINAFDATCPHRGAHLAFGGRLDGGALICPFHGRRINLGYDAKADYCIRDRKSVV